MKNLTKRQKEIFQYSFLIFLILITAYLVYTTLDISILSKIINIINYKYIFLGFLCILIYIAIESYIMNLILESICKVKTKFLSFNISTMGLYYNLVTPMASGSQPMQIYTLTKHNIPLSEASAVIVNKTIIFQTMVTIYSGVLLITNYIYLGKQIRPIILLVATGMIINIVSLSFGMLILYSPQKTKKLLNFLLNFCYRLKIVKNIKDKKQVLNEFIDDYNYSIKIFLKNKRALIKSLLLTLIQLTIYFSIAYCIYRALNLSSKSYINMLALQSFLYMAVSPVPTPGNVGANEMAFFTIFKNVIPKELLGYSVFLYGIFIYYFILIFCGIFTIIFHYKSKKITKKEVKLTTNI